jgi:hypothetical protein
VSIVFARWTQYKRRCPFCGFHFQTVFNPTALRVGSGYRLCGECGKTFSDGSIEWPDLTPAQKRKFLFGELPVFGALGALAVVWFTFIAIANGHTDFLFVILGALFAFGLIVLSIFYLICWFDIRRSKRRYEGQRN